MPQGSILGPLLFILTFDGIFHLPLFPECNLSGYADVTYSWPPSDESAVTDDLKVICEWLTSSGFRLNANKVKAMVISRKRSPPRPHLELEGDVLEYVDNFKLLGITVTNDISWKSHILHTVSKAKRLLGFFYGVFKEGGQQCLTRLYKSIVIPHLDYCSSVWDPPHKTYKEKLERVQSFAAQVVTGEWSQDSSFLRYGSHSVRSVYTITHINRDTSG